MFGRGLLRVLLVAILAGPAACASDAQVGAYREECITPGMPCPPGPN